MIVVKVGGSLYDHPRLGPVLRDYLDSLGEPVVVVPGGGPFADAVRELDRIHGLGESTSHWLALKAMSLAGEFLQRITKTRHTILDAFEFGVAMSQQIEESWETTSDSIAAKAAEMRQATRLILLKSVDVPPGTSWGEAASRGWVDANFPKAAANAKYSIDVINSRRGLEHGEPAA